MTRIMHLTMFVLAVMVLPGWADDCNNNGIPDDDDLANCDGSTWCDDCNGNGIIDECDLQPVETLASFFDSDSEGWTETGTGNVSYEPTGGNPGGYVRASDYGTDDVYLLAPSTFHGGLSNYDSGTMSFDGKLITNPNPYYWGFGDVTITGTSYSVSLDLAPTNPTSTWHTYSAPLTAQSWGTSDTVWADILADVVEITVSMEAGNGPGEVVGFDNFVLVSCPLSSDSNHNDLPDECECDVIAQRLGDCNGDGSTHLPQFLHGVFRLTGCSKDNSTAAPQYAAAERNHPATSRTPRVTTNMPTAVQGVWQAKQPMKQVNTRQVSELRVSC